MSWIVVLGGVRLQVTHGQSVDDDRESLEFREPGDLTSYLFEVAQYGEPGSGDLRLADVDELPIAVIIDAIEFARREFGEPGEQSDVPPQNAAS